MFLTLMIVPSSRFPQSNSKYLVYLQDHTSRHKKVHGFISSEGPNALVAKTQEEEQEPTEQDAKGKRGKVKD